MSQAVKHINNTTHGYGGKRKQDFKSAPSRTIQRKDDKKGLKEKKEKGDKENGEKSVKEIKEKNKNETEKENINEMSVEKQEESLDAEATDENKEVKNDNIALTTEEETVFIAKPVDENTTTSNRNTDIEVEENTSHKCQVTPENFNVKEFNTNLSEFIRSLSDQRFKDVTEVYPVDELVSAVNMINQTVGVYRAHTSDSQEQLAQLRETMKEIRENLHFSVSRQAMNLNSDEEIVSQEERDLQAKVAALNASLAQANADVTEAIRLATESEEAALKAKQEANRAREETRKIEEEIAKKEEAERKRSEDEKRRREEKKKEKEEKERKEAEERKKKEEEWKKKEQANLDRSVYPYDNWPLTEYERINENGDNEITCVARGKPGSFNKTDVTIKLANEKEAELTYLPNEEVISNVLELASNKSEESQLKEPIYISIPHFLSRSGAMSREPIVKAKVKGQWLELPTRDLTIDKYKDQKFAQAEVKHLTTLVVMSRFKCDYVTLLPKKEQKIFSSFDQRVTLTVGKNTLIEKDHFLVQVQPLEINSVNEFKQRETVGKGFLNGSPIVHTTWETPTFRQPILVTVPCPPNPAKAKKMAMMRKMKEEKMKNPQKPQIIIPIDEGEREREKDKKIIQPEVEGVLEKKQTKWFMGQYANNEDDERDKMYFLYLSGGKWLVDSNMQIKQVKVDMISFQLEQPVDKFIVIRTRTTVDEDDALAMIVSLTEYLTKRFVEAVVRQRSDDPYQIALQVTSVSRLDAVVNQLAQIGFETGPSPSHVLCVKEGDVIEVGFSGNLECTEKVVSPLIFKNNVPTVIFLRVHEENKFRQKEQQVYSGLISLFRRVIPHKGKGKEQTAEDGAEIKLEKLCALQVNVPKYPISTPTHQKKVPTIVKDHIGAVDDELLQTIASGLGDEWKRVAHYLGIRWVRVQAIIRTVNVGERTEEQARYDMLVTWHKRATRALDKVAILSSALRQSERHDLAEILSS